MQASPGIEISCPTAITNVGYNWRLSWNALLIGTRNFSAAKEVFSAFSASSASSEEPPVAAIRYWPSSPPVGGRIYTLAERIGNDIAKNLVGCGSPFRYDRLGLIFACSDGDPDSLTCMANARTDTPEYNESCRRILLQTLITPLAQRVPVHAPGIHISAACASCAVAAGLALQYISSGMYDGVIVASLDGLSRIAYAGFRQIGAMSKHGCRPLDRDRDGMTLGEGAVAFLLRRIEAKTKRSSHVTLIGFGMCCAADHPVAPSTSGIETAICSALNHAQLKPENIRAVFWHGTGTKQSDAAEALALRRIFGQNVPPSTSTKGTFGHTMGASSGLSLLAAYECIRSQLLPPVAGLQHPDFPDIPTPIGLPMKLQRGPILVLSAGFGGINTALVLSGGS